MADSIELGPKLKAAPTPMQKGRTHATWGAWFRQPWLAWVVAIALSAVPALVWGSSIFSILLLALTLLMSIPSLVLVALVGRKPSVSGIRSAVVMTAICGLSWMYVYEVDKLVPVKAAPVVDALEAFKAKHGSYPDALDQLTPSHLNHLPSVSLTWVQPSIRYGLTENKPYLRIASSRGDAFAVHEYDFATKRWRHLS
jgi:hypothetical protein